MNAIQTARDGQSSMCRELLWFIVIGLTVNAIYAGLFLLLVKVWPDQRAVVATVSYFSACAFQYMANAHATFNKRMLDASQFVRYAICVVVGALVSVLALVFVPKVAGVPDLLLIIVVAGLIASANFISFRYWVYRSKA